MEDKMKKLFFCLLLAIFLNRISAAPIDCLKINEIYFSSSGNDWVELCIYSSEKTSIDISNLYVTMYYSTNEKISQSSVTLYSYDRKETPYDDRYAVIYLTSNKLDETDLTGDTNKNGRLDLYCQNYSGSLWNNEGIVALDTNDDPSDGLIDFIFYSTCDGAISSSVAGYLQDAIDVGEWVAGSGNVQNYAVVVKSVLSYNTVSRFNSIDTNTNNDFLISSISTPGEKNNLKNLKSIKCTLFKLIKKKLVFSQKQSHAKIPLFLKKQCNLTLKIFSANGVLQIKSKKHQNVCPGKFELKFKMKKKLSPGIYIGLIEGYNDDFHLNQKLKFVVIIAG